MAEGERRPRRGSLRFGAPRVALVREVSSRFAECQRSSAGPPPDVERARAQHAAYVGLLRELGVEVRFIARNDDLPDGCFVEDTAVVSGSHAVLSIPGAPSRQAETREVLPVLADFCQVHPMEGDARLDGGDVLRVGDVLFVGLSARSNAAGAAALARVARLDGLETRTLVLSSGLHLKSGCTLLDETTLLHAPSLGPRELETLRASGCEILMVPEEAGANVLALGEAVLVSAAAPRTAELIAARGKRVHRLDVGQMHAADGALTCLSLRIPRAGEWVA